MVWPLLAAVAGGIFASKQAKKNQQAAVAQNDLQNRYNSEASELAYQRELVAARKLYERQIEAREKMRKWPVLRLNRLREDAEKAGFNPLTVLQLTGGAGYGQIPLPIEGAPVQGTPVMSAPPLADNSWRGDVFNSIISAGFQAMADGSLGGWPSKADSFKSQQMSQRSSSLGFPVATTVAPYRGSSSAPSLGVGVRPPPALYTTRQVDPVVVDRPDGGGANPYYPTRTVQQEPLLDVPLMKRIELPDGQKVDVINDEAIEVDPGSLSIQAPIIIWQMITDRFSKPNPEKTILQMPEMLRPGIKMWDDIFQPWQSPKLEYRKQRPNRQGSVNNMPYR